MSRRRSPAVDQRNVPVLARIQALKADHPFWGYRRIWAHLRFVDGLRINKKRVLRLMRIHGLLVKPNHRLKATRTPRRSKPRPTAPQQWWGIDMTKVMVDPIGWVYLVLVLRGGSGSLDSFCQFISGAWRMADYAAVRRVVRLSKYTPSGVWPSSA